MLRFKVVLLLLVPSLFAETRTLTLSEAVTLAMKQGPDVILARLDEQRTALDAKVARDPFVTKVSIGSGLAYTDGFPLSIEGSAPSIFQAHAIQSILNRPRSYLVAQARENARGATIDAQMKQEDVVLRTANLFLDARRAARLKDLVGRQVTSLEHVLATVKARVADGRELPIEEKRAMVNLAKAKQRVRIVETDSEYTGRTLAAVLGFPAEDKVVPADQEGPQLEVPMTGDLLVEEALTNSRELKRLRSSLLAKGFELKSYRSARLPQVDLVAQYALLARFNNYEDFYNGFQRHNGQIGLSFQLPILPGAAPKAQASQAEIDDARLRTQINQARSRIEIDARRAYQDFRDAEAARDVVRMDLELARDQLSVLLARMQEGRASTREIEEARFVENERWIAFYDALHTLEQARLNVMKQRGDLLALLQ